MNVYYAMSARCRTHAHRKARGHPSRLVSHGSYDSPGILIPLPPLPQRRAIRVDEAEVAPGSSRFARARARIGAAERAPSPSRCWTSACVHTCAGEDIVRRNAELCGELGLHEVCRKHLSVGGKAVVVSSKDDGWLGGSVPAAQLVVPGTCSSLL